MGKKIKRTTADIPAMRYSHAEKAADKLYEVGIKLAFVTESAAFLHKNHDFSEAGINGLWHMLINILDDVLEAGRQLEKVRSVQ